jgi:hypothetical protein
VQLLSTAPLAPSLEEVVDEDAANRNDEGM